MSKIATDINGHDVPLMVLSAPQNNIAVNGSAGAAVLSAALTRRFVRVTPISDVYCLPTAATVAAGSVSASTGHYLIGGIPTDIHMPLNTDKLAFLAVSTIATTVSISEMG